MFKDENFDLAHVGASDVGYTLVRQGDENALKAAVATVGPISIAIDASHSSFQHAGHGKAFSFQCYLVISFAKLNLLSGIYYEPYCDSIKVDHAVLVVGYGTENGQDYWLVKNSWSEHWGDQGYIKMARNRGNNCGIASYGVYPLV